MAHILRKGDIVMMPLNLCRVSEMCVEIVETWVLPFSKRGRLHVRNSIDPGEESKCAKHFPSRREHCARI